MSMMGAGRRFIVGAGATIGGMVGWWIVGKVGDEVYDRWFKPDAERWVEGQISGIFNVIVGMMWGGEGHFFLVLAE